MPSRGDFDRWNRQASTPRRLQTQELIGGEPGMPHRIEGLDDMRGSAGRQPITDRHRTELARAQGPIIADQQLGLNPRHARIPRIPSQQIGKQSIGPSTGQEFAQILGRHLVQMLCRGSKPQPPNE